MEYLSEAFKELKILDEDVFDLDKEGLEDLRDFQDEDEEEVIDVYDPDAETEEELEDSYVGKVILDCSVCHTDIYKDKEDVIIDEDTQLANVGEECPYCFSIDGFKVIGEVKPFVETTFETEDDVDVEVDGEEVEDEDMNESFKRHKKIVESKSRVGRKSLTESSNGKKKYIVTNIDYDIEEEDIDGEDFEHDEFGNPHSWSKEEKISLIKDNLPDRLVIYANSEDDIADEISNMTGWLVNDFDYKVEVEEEEESLRRKRIRESISKMHKKALVEKPVYGLEPRYDSRKSFYGKAQVDTGDKGEKNKLYSYNTLVAEIKDGKPVVYDTYSATTLRHIKEWLKQNGFKADTSKQIVADYGVKDESCGRKSIKESVVGNAANWLIDKEGKSPKEAEKIINSLNPEEIEKIALKWTKQGKLK